MRWIYSVVPNFAVSMILYLLLMRLIMIFFDYTRGVQKAKSLLAKPYLFKIKEKFLGREGNNFENATMEIFKATKSNYISSALPVFIEYPIIIGLFFSLYHPISVLFPKLRDSIPEMAKIAEGISHGNIQELNIVSAVRKSPEAFSVFDISGIKSVNSSFCGIDIFETARFGDITMILPLIAIAYYLFVIIKLLVPVFKKQKKLREVALFLALYIIVGCSITASAFSLPLVFYCYLLIFIPIGSLSNKLVTSFIVKTKKPWVERQNKVCQEILKKYGIEEYVSALREDSDTETTVSETENN